MEDSKSSSRVLDVSPALAGEIIGAAVTVEKAPGIARLPLTGTIVDETLKTLHIQPRGGHRARVIPKAGLVGTILLGGRELVLSGEALRVRPEDRTKRLQLRGRRSQR